MEADQSHEEAAQADLISTLPDWLVSRDEDDKLVSERADRFLRLLVSYLP
jgi:hypothetical protein